MVLPEQLIRLLTTRTLRRALPLLLLLFAGLLLVHMLHGTEAVLHDSAATYYESARCQDSSSWNDAKGDRIGPPEPRSIAYRVPGGKQSPSQNANPSGSELQSQQEAGASSSSLKVAYLLLVHSNDTVASAKHLLRAIWRPDFHYLVLIDKSMHRDMRTHLISFLDEAGAVNYTRGAHDRQPSNVQFLDAPHRAGWGSLGLVRNTLEGLVRLLAMGQWDYAINLSGDTYPLVSQEGLVDRLARWRGMNFLTSDGIEPKTGSRLSALKRSRVKDVVAPPGIEKLDHSGSQWFVLTRDFVNYAVWSQQSRELLEAYTLGKAKIADESFLHVLIMNSPTWAKTIVMSQNVSAETTKRGAPVICRLIIWEKCNYTKPGFPRAHPCFLGPKDLPRLQRSSCILTRKVDPLIDGGQLYSALDELIALDRRKLSSSSSSSVDP